MVQHASFTGRSFLRVKDDHYYVNGTELEISCSVISRRNGMMDRKLAGHRAELESKPASQGFWQVCLITNLCSFFRCLILSTEPAGSPQRYQMVRWRHSSSDAARTVKQETGSLLSLLTFWALTVCLLFYFSWLQSSREVNPSQSWVLNRGASLVIWSKSWLTRRPGELRNVQYVRTLDSMMFSFFSFFGLWLHEDNYCSNY